MITLGNLQHKKYAVLGLGKSGIATAATLQASGADFIVWDDQAPAREKASQSGYNVSDPCQTDLTGFAALIMAPGIPLTHPTPHPAAIKARACDVPVIGDIELLFKACPKATYIGITGTNGKSTTTALIGHILQQAGRKVQVGGNLGTPVLALETLDADGIYVLELSSYQLDLFHSNLLKVAVFLNLTPDHLDRHGDMAGYLAAKSKIISQQAPQTLVLGTDEPEMRALAQQVKAKPHLKLEEISVTHPITQGVMLAGQQLFLFDGEESGGPYVNLPSLPALPGLHNAQNAAAAIAACRALGLTKPEIIAGLRSFPGLAHRQQLVATLKDVRFINDSKATNADAASKALACYDNIYWIIGGLSKTGGLNGLENFMPRIRHAFLIGKATEEFATWLNGKASFTRCGTLDQAVQQAAQMAWREKVVNAVVLLSPACASWDQFKSFEDRGEQFIQFVNHLQPTQESVA